jgi:hypothetical protein
LGWNEVEDPALAGLRLSAAGLAGSAAHPPLRGSATETPVHRTDHKLTMRLSKDPRLADDRQNQGLAPAKEATAKAPVRDWPGRGLSSGQSRAGACRAGSQVRAGPFSSNAAPSRARHRTGGKERVSSPAPHSGRCRGFAPAEGVAGDSAAAPGQGKAFPIFMLRFMAL